MERFRRCCTSFSDAGTGNQWSADTGYLGGLTYSTAQPIALTPTPQLYQSERYGAPNVHYNFQVPNGTYTVTLKFAEIYFTAAAQRIFNIVINGSIVWSGFDPYVQSVGSNRAVDKSFALNVTNGQIDIRLDSIVSNEKIAAIEIVQ